MLGGRCWSIRIWWEGTTWSRQSQEQRTHLPLRGTAGYPSLSCRGASTCFEAG